MGISGEWKESCKMNFMIYTVLLRSSEQLHQGGYSGLEGWLGCWNNKCVWNFGWGQYGRL